MKKPLVILIIILIFLAGLFFTGFYTPASKITHENKTVYIKKSKEGFHLYRNGEPFYIQGVGGNMNLEFLAEIGGNTIRVYDTLNLGSILNEAHKNNLAVIADIPIPPYNKTYNYYSNEIKNRALINNIQILINKHKNHPALLMWNLGNETNYPLVLRKNDFIKVFNEILSVIKAEDPNHPVSTTLPGVIRKSATSIYIHSPQLDILSFNIFGNINDYNSKLNQLYYLFGSRPHYMGELGPDGPWGPKFTAWNAPIEPTSTNKVEQIQRRFNLIQQNVRGECLGSLFFYWGFKLERTYTWFSLFKENYKSEVIREIDRLWNRPYEKSDLIGLEYILIEGKSTYDNIIYPPNELKQSEVKFINDYDTGRIEWVIYPEAWPWSWSVNHISGSYTIFNPEKTINSFVNFEGNTASFITPEEEGPYRLFAYVYDENGYYATANIPFYILDPK
jgi:hypothetical protein